MNVPTRTRNSLTKGASPGRERVARPPIRKVPARIGATFCTPPKSAMSREPRREIRNPAISISTAVEMPWLTMYSVAPDWPWLVIAKMPMMMKPKCEIDA